MLRYLVCFDGLHEVTFQFQYDYNIITPSLDWMESTRVKWYAEGLNQLHEWAARGGGEGENRLSYDVK